MCEYYHVCARSLELEVSERLSRVLPKKAWRDNVKGGMKKYQLTENMTQDQKYWMAKICPAMHNEMVMIMLNMLICNCN